MYPLGLEFVSGASMTFVVPSLMSSGLGGNVVGMVVASGPMLAMVMGPKVGALSDSFSHSNPTQGKRTPFIFGLTALILLSLLVIPYRYNRFSTVLKSMLIGGLINEPFFDQ